MRVCGPDPMAAAPAGDRLAPTHNDNEGAAVTGLAPNGGIAAGIILSAVGVAAIVVGGAGAQA